MEESGHLKRKIFIGGNWKSNGTIEFVKDIVSNMINQLDYNKDLIGKTLFFIS